MPHGAEGVVTLVVGEEERVVPARPGVVAYYPGGYPHTIRSVGEGPVQYLMVKWLGPRRRPKDPLQAQIVDLDELAPPTRDGVRHAVLFEGPTGRARRVRCHLTTLTPDAGYAPHVDSHDVTIVLLEGTVETLGQTITAPAVAFTAGGWAHGIRNVGDTSARYLVVEVHGPGPSAPLRRRRRAPTAARRPAPALRRRARVAVWSAGGRLLRRIPRVKQGIRRIVGRLSPWT